MTDQKISTSAVAYSPAFTANKEELKKQTLRKEILSMLGILALLSVAVFHKFIFGFAVYLFKDIGSDSLNIYYPHLINISEILWGGEFPGWSFEQGLGQNIFPFALSDPTAYLLYFLGSKNLSFGIIWVELFKIISSGLLFFCFLKKLRLSTNTAYIGGILYAFSGFMIVGGGWCSFSTVGMYTALMLLAFEMLYIEKKWWLFPFSVALLAAHNFVNLYTFSVFLFFYVFFRVLSEEELDLKRCSKLLVHMLLLGALGVLISAVFSLPNLMQMIDSPRVSGKASLANELATIPIFGLGNGDYLVTLVMRIFSNDIMGNGSHFKGWTNYLEAPMSYCGLISLVLVPQVFCFLKARQKIVYGSFISIFIFAEIFPWFRRGFWLFQGDYFRDFSLYGAIIFILFSMLALDTIVKGRRVNLIVLCASFFTLLILLCYPYTVNLKNQYGLSFNWKAPIDHGIQTAAVIFLALICANLILLSFRKNRKYAQIGLLVITFIELASFNYVTVNRRDVVTAADMHKKIGYNDYSIEAIAFIKQQDTGFFRIEKNYGSSPAMHTSINDSKVQHYFGSSSYHSFNQLNYIKFLSATDLLNQKMENETRWLTGVRDNILLQALTGVRYFLFKNSQGSASVLDDTHINLGVFGDITVFKSKYALPIGVAYDSYIVQSDFNRLASYQKHVALLKAIMIPDGMASELSSMTRISGGDLPNSDYSSSELALDTDLLKAHSLRMNHFSNNSLDGTIATRIKQLVFFNFPFDNGWQALVNGKETPMLMVNGGLSAVLVNPGENIISLRYSPLFVKEGAVITLFGLLIFGVAVFMRHFPGRHLDWRGRLLGD